MIFMLIDSPDGHEHTAGAISTWNVFISGFEIRSFSISTFSFCLFLFSIEKERRNDWKILMFSCRCVCSVETYGPLSGASD
jgi:hypothetical protein